MKRVIALEDVRMTIVEGCEYSVEEDVNNKGYYVVAVGGRKVLFLKSHFEDIGEEKD